MDTSYDLESIMFYGGATTMMLLRSAVSVVRTLKQQWDKPKSGSISVVLVNGHNKFFLI